jgi:hypothetical protein
MCVKEVDSRDELPRETRGHCEGGSPKQSPVGGASRPSSFPRTRSREARDRLDPGSESGVTNDRRGATDVQEGVSVQHG